MSWLSSAVSNATDYFSNLWTNVIKPEVKTAEQVAAAMFQTAITDVATELGIVGMQIVTDSVAAAETTGGTGSVKLAAATAAAMADLTKAAISVPAHILNVALEGAVAQLNASEAAKTATAATADAQQPAS